MTEKNLTVAGFVVHEFLLDALGKFVIDGKRIKIAAVPVHRHGASGQLRGRSSAGDHPHAQPVHQFLSVGQHGLPPRGAVPEKENEVSFLPQIPETVLLPGEVGQFDVGK